MRRLSHRHHLKISKRDLDREQIISEIREIAKNDQGVIEKFREYNMNLDDIDQVHISFVSLPVSAKTKDKKIYLNEKLLEEGDPVKNAAPYIIHEIIHYLQQVTGKNIDKGKAEDEYLDKETEEEAFKVQIDFKKREEGEEEAEEYLENLLDHHDMKGKKRKEKKDDLLDG